MLKAEEAGSQDQPGWKFKKAFASMLTKLCVIDSSLKSYPGDVSKEQK